MECLVGKVFGKLTVLSQKGKLKQWVCKCSCGKEVVVKESKLISKHTKSCGCGRVDTPKLHMLSKATLAKRKLKIGLRFGRLLLVEVYPTRAKCDCGNIIDVKRHGSLHNGDLQSCGCLNSENAKRKQAALVGKYRSQLGVDVNTPLTDENTRLRVEFSKELRPKILSRDNYTCMLCNCRGVELNVHHIEPWSANIEKRFDEGNLITLCRDCHINLAHGGNVHGKCSPIIQSKLKEIVNGFVLSAERNTIGM